jgi:hypothetical protein
LLSTRRSATSLGKKTLGGADVDSGHGVAIGSDEAIYVTGYANGVGAGGADLLVARYTSSGELSWSNVLGSTSAENGTSIAVDADGSVLVTGLTNSTETGSYDLLIARLPSMAGPDLSAGPFIWQAASLAVGSNPVLANAPSNLTPGPNPNLTLGSNPTLAIGAGASLTGTTEQFVED